MKACIASGQEQGHLSKKEADLLTKRYDEFLVATGSPIEARALLLDLLAAEIEHRKRVAVLAEERRKPLLAELHGFRDVAGRADLPLAHRLQHDKMGHEGQFSPSEVDPHAGLSANDLMLGWMSKVNTMIEEAKWELRGGYISGDARRTSKTVAKVSPKARAVQARMANVQLEMRGVKTGDDLAARLAKAYMDAGEMLKEEFNRLGGAVGTLDNWGGPQMHNQEALINVGPGRWIDYMLGDGVLDRERMTHPLTGKRMTDAQLREALEHVWMSITTDGRHDQKLSMQRTGRGALFSQHADHRFLHYTPDGWLKYAKDFGNPDFHAAMMSHFGLMARDIAHMTKFGPNPDGMRAYLRAYIETQASTIKPIEVLIGEQGQRMRDLVARLSSPNQDYQRLADRLAALTGEAMAVRGDIRAGFSALHMPPWRELTSTERAELARLQTEITAVLGEMAPFHAGIKPKTIEDTAIALQLRDLTDKLRDPVAFAKVERADEYARSSLAFTDYIWEYQRGALNAPLVVKLNLFRGWHLDVERFFGTIRHLNTATKLHSAILSAISDTSFQSIRRHLAGMSVAEANPVAVLVDTIKAMVPREDGERRYAARSGVVADASIGAWQAQARMAGSLDTRRWTGFIADRVIHLQGLSAWTLAGKTAFGLELMGHMADHVGMAWAALPEPVRNTLAKGGFTSRTWDQIRAAQLDEPRPGATFLRPVEIEAAAGRDLSLRYTAMILRETRYAVPETTPTAQAMMLGGTRAGTVGGTLARSFSQFKSFGFTVAMLHIGQIASDLGAGRKQAAASYAAQLLLGGAMLGAVAMALKDINSGRDPRKMLDENTYLDPEFWGAALLQAGGLGIYGDFLFGQLNRHGSGLASTIAGPTVQMAGDFLNLTGGNVQQLIKGKDTRFGAEAVNFTRKHLVPNVVFTKLAWERTVMDQLQTLIDKDAKAAFQRQISTRRNEYGGQEFWWPPGKPAPVRPPNPARAFAVK